MIDTKRITELEETVKDWDEIVKSEEEAKEGVNLIEEESKILNKEIKWLKVKNGLQIVQIIVAITLIISGVLLIKNMGSPIMTAILMLLLFIIGMITPRIDIYVKDLELEARNYEIDSDKKLLMHYLTRSYRRRYIINRLYDDAHTIMSELEKIPNIKGRIKKIKKEHNIDFSYLTDEIKKLEELDKSWENKKE